MNDNDGRDKVISALKEKDNFLVTAHINPEGDSIGSQLALLGLLEKMEKKAVVVDQDAVPENLGFVPGTERIIFGVPEDFRPEVALVLDCPVKERVGGLASEVDKADLVINIDHHVSNEFFGDINWVEPEASSVGEMIYDLYEKLGIMVDEDAAVALYVAILTDTGMFNYDNTSGRTHEMAGRLLERGVKPDVVFNEIYEKKPLSQLRMLGRVLETVKVEEGGAVAHMSLTSEMYEKENVTDVSTEEFINYLRAIRGVKAAIFFKEKPGDKKHVDVSFRSAGEVDVNLVASHLGGGGHKRASGCKLDCGMKDAKKKVLAEVRKVMAEKDA